MPTEKESAQGVDHLNVEVRWGVPGCVGNPAGQVEMTPDEPVDDHRGVDDDHNRLRPALISSTEEMSERSERSAWADPVL